MKFSVLMSIYHKEKPEFFDRAIHSIWDHQKLKPNEIVLVKDGPLTKQLEKSIDEWRAKLNKVLKVISLEKNVGLGDALNIGLRHCSFDVVARMDTDDISHPDRFKKQVEALDRNNTIAVISSWVSEFEGDEQNTISYRKVPILHEEILEYAKNRNPVNHPSAMYRKKSVLEAGGYLKMMFFEDYYLWIRMLKMGHRFANIPEPLVNMRAGYPQLVRRSGFSYAKEEFKFQKEIYRLGFITTFQFFKNILARLGVRIMPKVAVKRIYCLLREH